MFSAQCWREDGAVGQQEELSPGAFGGRRAPQRTCRQRRSSRGASVRGMAPVPIRACLRGRRPPSGFVWNTVKQTSFLCVVCDLGQKAT